MIILSSKHAFHSSKFIFPLSLIIINFASLHNYPPSLPPLFWLSTILYLNWCLPSYTILSLYWRRTMIYWELDYNFKFTVSIYYLLISALHFFTRWEDPFRWSLLSGKKHLLIIWLFHCFAYLTTIRKGNSCLSISQIIVLACHFIMFFGWVFDWAIAFALSFPWARNLAFEFLLQSRQNLFIFLPRRFYCLSWATTWLDSFIKVIFSIYQPIYLH